MVQTHKNYGLLTALAMIIIGVILHITEIQYTSQWSSNIVYIPFLIGVILNAVAFSKANDSYVTFGQTFSSGFKMCAITTLVMIVWGLLAVYLIFPEIKEKSIEVAFEQMRNNPDTTDEQIAQAESYTKQFFVPFMIGGLLFSNMFIGAIFSLIGAAVAKTNGAPKQH